MHAPSWKKSGSCLSPSSSFSAKLLVSVPTSPPPSHSPTALPPTRLLSPFAPPLLLQTSRTVHVGHQPRLLEASHPWARWHLEWRPSARLPPVTTEWSCLTMGRVWSHRTKVVQGHKATQDRRKEKGAVAVVREPKGRTMRWWAHHPSYHSSSASPSYLSYVPSDDVACRCVIQVHVTWIYPSYFCWPYNKPSTELCHLMAFSMNLHCVTCLTDVGMVTFVEELNKVFSTRDNHDIFYDGNVVQYNYMRSTWSI